jgi:hypothetical protein
VARLRGILWSFRDTRGESFLDRLALLWLTRGRRGGWVEVGRTDYSGVVEIHNRNFLISRSDA